MDWKEALGKLSREEFPDPVNETEPETIQPAEVKKTDILRVITDRKQRKGKTATIVEGFTCPDEELKQIARELKTRIGAGGSVRDGEILVQGDCAPKVMDALRGMGYKVKR